jgi:hypothetical protein
MGHRLNLLAGLALFLLTIPAFAEDDRYMRLSRISYLEGNVSYQRAPDVDWSAASINMPLEPGDRIYTGPNGRTEIEFDDNSVLRLAENTDVEIMSLNEDVVKLRMLVGLATLNIASDADYEINTPAAAFNSVRKGNYRFEVSENGDTDAIVRKGRIEAENSSFSRDIDSGMRLRVRAVDDGNHAVAMYEQRDSWDEWNDRRDVDRRAYASRRYLPGTVYMGAAELDRYGRWVNVSDYGTAWVPYSVDVYWSPYSVGRWCYRPYYGWTWVSYEPWGWLPYHYGRWYQSSSFGWCWLPGPSFSFNFWSPGLVAFYNGPGWVSWLPLGPGDYYNVNHYHYNRGIYSYQLARLRELHTRSQGDYYNRDARGAFRTVQIDHFKNGSFNERSANTRWGNIDRPWKEGNLVRDSLDIRPTSGSYRAAPDRNVSRPREDHARSVVERSNSRINQRTEGRTAVPVADRREGRTENRIATRTVDPRETQTETGTRARTEDRGESRTEPRTTTRAEDRRPARTETQTPARTEDRREGRPETRTTTRIEDRRPVRTETQTPARNEERRNVRTEAPTTTPMETGETPKRLYTPPPQQNSSRGGNERRAVETPQQPPTPAPTPEVRPESREPAPAPEIRTRREEAPRQSSRQNEYRQSGRVERAPSQERSTSSANSSSGANQERWGGNRNRER